VLRVRRKAVQHRYEWRRRRFVRDVSPIEPRFRRAAAYGAYEGALRDLIHLFKYKGNQAGGELLGSLLNQAVTTMALPDSVIVVPVPLWSGKRVTRGFNQAEAIARTFMDFQTSSSIQLDTSILVRTRETASQTGLTRHQRRAKCVVHFLFGSRKRSRAGAF